MIIYFEVIKNRIKNGYHRVIIENAIYYYESSET